MFFAYFLSVLPSSFHLSVFSFVIVVAMASPETIQELLNGPALAPPPHVTPNLVNPPNLNNYWIATLVICIFISTLTVFTRMYTKIFIAHKVAWADCEQFLRCHSAKGVELTSHRHITSRLGGLNKTSSIPTPANS